MYSFKNSEISKADIISGAIYCSNMNKKIGDREKEPLNALFSYPSFKSVGNQGGIRRAMKERCKSKDEAYVVLLNTKNRTDWPNEYNPFTKILTYYGDNDSVGKDIFDTKQKGNKFLKKIFDLAAAGQRKMIPPIFYFEKTGNNNDVKFIGLAVPYVKGIPTKELLKEEQFEKDGSNYKNYIAKFTILDKLVINREWIRDLKLDLQIESKYIPLSWLNYILTGEILIENDASLINYSEAEELLNLTHLKNLSQSLVKVRLTQRKFREMLLDKYKKCQLCDIDIPELLIASHIKPWNVSDDEEKIDINNGLLLCANHDKLFDRNFITFNNDGSIKISDNIPESKYGLLNIKKDFKLLVQEKSEPYLTYHRSLFRK